MYLCKGEYDKAIADYDRALEFDPTYALARDGRALALSKKEVLDEARNHTAVCDELNGAVRLEFPNILY